MKKKLKIALFIVLALLIIFTFVSYIVWKDQTKEVLDYIINFLNKPIVVAGVSTTIGGFLLFLIVKYIFDNSKIGKKRLLEIEEENDKLKGQLKETEKKCFELCEQQDFAIKSICEQYEELKNTMIKHLNLSKNIKDKDLIEYLKGEQPYGEEEVDSQEETETL